MQGKIDQCADRRRVEEVGVADAWRMLKKDKEAQLIDVRTTKEWATVGVPNLASVKKPLHKICLREWPVMDLNPHFVEELVRALPNKDVPLFFLCRSGGRSRDAAHIAMNQGYTRCYNIVGGFEGAVASDGTIINGWMAESLPWERK